MYLIKKIIGILFFPLTLILLVQAAGIISRKRRYIVSSFFLLILFSLKPLPTMLLKSLENQYPVILKQNMNSSVKWIVVLSGGNNPDTRLPPASQLTPTSLVRLVESVNLLRALPQGRLILSGGKTSSTVSEAQSMAIVAKSMGVEEKKFILEEDSKNTEQQALYLKPLVGTDVFYLVTSASHMPRAMGLMKKQGLNAIAAPVGHLAREVEGGAPMPSDFFPSGNWLHHTEVGFYENLGMLWAKLLGKI